MSTYAAGLRIREACQLQIADLLSDRHQIRVIQGKGQKDRHTIFRHGSRKSCAAAGGFTASRTGVYPSRVYPERHVKERGKGLRLRWKRRDGRPRRNTKPASQFDNPVLEVGVDPLTLQRLLGHSSLKTIGTYLHMRQERLAQISSALNLIDFGQAKQAS